MVESPAIFILIESINIVLDNIFRILLCCNPGSIHVLTMCFYSMNKIGSVFRDKICVQGCEAQTILSMDRGGTSVLQ